MKVFFTTSELYEIRSALCEQLLKKEEMKNRLVALNDGGDCDGLISGAEIDIADIRSALVKVKNLF